MIPMPEVVPTTIHAALPEDMLLLERESAMSRDMFRGRPIGSFLEGPSFDRDGNLFMVDIAHGRILKLSPAGAFSTVTQYDGQPNGLKIHKDGRLFVADRQNGIMEIDPVNGKVETLLGRDDLPGFKGPNDLFFDSNGNIYFTDQGETGLHDPTGRVFMRRPDGTLRCILDNVPSPNGLVMDPAEEMLYVAVTRTNSVWRVPIRPDGSIHRVDVFVRLVGGRGPDGLAVDVDGNVAIAHAGFGCVWLVSAMGVPTHKIEACDGGPHTTNIAYGGPEMKSLFITNSFSDNVLRAELDTPGEPMFAHMD